MKLLKFLSLSSSDRQLLVNAAVLLTAIRLGLWLLPFQTLQHLVGKMIQTPSTLEKVDRVSIDKVTWAVSVASRYMPGKVKCFARALATQVLLGQLGHHAQVRIGVAKSEKGKLEAHAWVESQGTVVIGNLKDLGRFSPLPNLEAFRS